MGGIESPGQGANARAARWIHRRLHRDGRAHSSDGPQSRMPFTRTSRGVLLAAWLVLFCPLYRGRGRSPRGAGEGWGYLGGLGAGQPRLPRKLVVLAAGAAVGPATQEMA